MGFIIRIMLKQYSARTSQNSKLYTLPSSSLSKFGHDLSPLFACPGVKIKVIKGNNYLTVLSILFGQSRITLSVNKSLIADSNLPLYLFKWTLFRF